MPTEEKNPAKEKKTRVVLTPAERIAKAKAELEALEKKEADKAKAKLADAEDRLKKAKAKQSEATAKVVALQDEVTELKKLVNPAA